MPKSHTSQPSKIPHSGKIFFEEAKTRADANQRYVASDDWGEKLLYNDLLESNQIKSNQNFTTIYHDAKTTMKKQIR